MRSRSSNDPVAVDPAVATTGHDAFPSAADLNQRLTQRVDIHSEITRSHREHVPHPSPSIAPVRVTA
jgi:hypothetical protein